MGENTKIEWAHHTFNPWYGCTKVGPGCDNCYAEAWAKRSGLVKWGFRQERRRTTAANWRKPLAWNAEAERLGIRYRVFCASLADVFDNSVPPEWRVELFRLIRETPHLDWLLLTKRIGNVSGMVPLPWVSKPFQHGPDPTNIYPTGWPPNVWIGATICNQEEADRDIPKLLAVPAHVRFLSMEPLLGAVGLPFDRLREWNRIALLNQQEYAASNIDWVIVGGESGPHARPMHPDWARSIRDQCAAAGVPFLFKQWGELAHDSRIIDTKDNTFHRFEDGTWMQRVGKREASRLLDGVEHNDYPAAGDSQILISKVE